MSKILRVWGNFPSTTAAVSQAASQQSRTHSRSIMSSFITRLLLPLRHTVWGSAIDYTFCTLLLLLSVLSGRGEQKYELSQRAAADGIASRHTDNSLCVPSLRKLQKYVDFCAITYAIVQWCAATRLKRLSFCQMRQSGADLSFLIKRNAANAAMITQRKHHLKEEISTVTEQILMECSQKSFDRPRHLTSKRNNSECVSYTHITNVKFCKRFCKASKHKFGGQKSAKNLKCDWTKFCPSRCVRAN